MAVITEANTRFALPIVCPKTREHVSAETLYNRCCADLGYVVRDHIGDLVLDNLAYGAAPERDDKALCDAVYAWADGVHSQLSAKAKRRLTCNSNGVICLETREPGRLSSGIARDLIFNIQWFSNKGWINHGEFVDPPTARQCFREQRKCNPTIRWRLIARNEYGQVKLPNNWRGGYGS